MEPKFNPESLTLVRDLEGLTQTALARELGITQGTVSKIEDGTIAVDEPTLQLLSDRFNRPKSFFCQAHAARSDLAGFYRLKSKLTKKIEKRCEAIMFIELCRIRGLDLIHKKIPKIPLFDPEDYIGGAKEIARIVRQNLRVPTGPIHNLTEIVERANCIVQYIDFGTLKVDGYSVIKKGHTPHIFINRAYPSDRRRLTLAHEFGHILMHRFETDTMEEEAFDFAGEFLMPEAEIRHTLYPLKLDKLAALKLKWGVSMAAILYHGRRIGAISERYYRYLNMQMGKAGYRTQEPHSERIPKEPTHKLSNIIKYVLKENLADQDTICELLGIYVIDLENMAKVDTGHNLRVI